MSGLHLDAEPALGRRGILEPGRTKALAMKPRDSPEDGNFVRGVRSPGEARFREIFDHAPDGIFIADAQQRYTDVNPAGCRMLGYERAELLTMSIPQIVVIEDQPRVPAEVGKLAFDDSELSRWTFRRKDGTCFPGEVGAKKLPDGRFVAFLRDLTAHERVAQELRASEERFRSAFENAAIGRAIALPEGRFARVNSAFAAMLGYSPGELLARTWMEITHPDDLAESARRSHALWSGENRTFRFEHRLVRKSGGIVWVDLSVVIVRDAADRPLYFIGDVIDVSERRQAEMALEEARSFLQQVVDTSPHMIFVKDRWGRAVFVNEYTARYYGTTTRELMAQRTETVHQEGSEAEAFVSDDREVIRTRQKIEKEELNTAPDGEQHWFHTVKVPLVRSDGTVEVLGIATDITQLKRAEADRRSLEAKIQHSQKLESLGILAGGIAHDFNNILTGILGYADLAMMELPQDSYARSLLAEVIKGAGQAAGLTKQMLAYSGKGRFVVKPLDLNAVIRDLGQFLGLTISKKCFVKYDFTPDLPAIDADDAQLRQVVMNLLINASDAMGDEGGLIQVSTGVMTCDRAYLWEPYLDHDLPEGAYVFPEVADTGCGMSEDTRKKVFDPFFTTKFTGRGLGLSAVLGIVRGHRGLIKIYSEPGKGTIFKVAFPPSSQPAVSEPDARTDSRWRGSGKVLVVDDEALVRRLARRMLEQMGFEVVLAETGRAGVEAFRRGAKEFRLVLLDMTMPELDGEEAFREMRRIRDGVKAVLMSGYNEQTATSRFVGKGLAGFVQKPFRYEELLAVVRSLLEHA
jgi:two-component system cell cycle sensor histidine kinase/response regulator CckA